MADLFRVIVAFRPKGRSLRYASYPASGCSLYSRAEAVKLLQRFHARHPYPEGHEMTPYAEGDHERFDVHFPDDLTGTP